MRRSCSSSASDAAGPGRAGPRSRAHARRRRRDHRRRGTPAPTQVTLWVRSVTQRVTPPVTVVVRSLQVGANIGVPRSLTSGSTIRPWRHSIVRAGGLTSSEAVRTALREAAARRRVCSAIRLPSERTRGVAAPPATRSGERAQEPAGAALPPRAVPGDDGLALARSQPGRARDPRCGRCVFIGSPAP
jgi:hypothetical protein